IAEPELVDQPGVLDAEVAVAVRPTGDLQLVDCHMQRYVAEASAAVGKLLLQPEDLAIWVKYPGAAGTVPAEHRALPHQREQGEQAAVGVAEEPCGTIENPVALLDDRPELVFKE